MLVLEPKQRGSMKEAHHRVARMEGVEITPSWIARDISDYRGVGSWELGMVNDGYRVIDVFCVFFFLTKHVGMIARS